MFNFTKISLLTLLFLPFLTSAQDPEDLGDIGPFIASIIGFIGGILIPFVFAVALLVFIWGMFQYFIAGGADENKRTQGKALIMWGIIGFVMMVIIIAVVNLLSAGFFSANQVPGSGDDSLQNKNIPKVNLP